jgi:hypothetical protein
MMVDTRMATLLNPTRSLYARQRFTVIESDATEELSSLRNGGLDQPGVPAKTVLYDFPAVELPQPRDPVPSYVHGVSLTSVLQMLHLERMTCLLEVTAEGQFGTMTLVNGELVDAEAIGLDGEEAVYCILAWRHPHTTILDGITLFRNTVKSSLAALIVESVRLQDECACGTVDPDTVEPPDGGTTGEAAIASGQASERVTDWQWLAEMLIISGATAAAVIQACDERVLAQACEQGFGVVGAGSDAADGFTPVVRAASHWARQVFPTIDEVALRLGERHALISPLGPDRKIFVCATFAGREAMDLARSAIRVLIRS